jgi:hypothetical protein
LGALETNTTLIYGVHIRESANDGSDFSNAAADYRVLFLGEDGVLHVKDSSGTVSNAFTGGGTPTFSGARAFNSATQSINDSTITAVTFNSENYDTNSIHDVGSNTSRFTCHATGYWRFTGGTTWDTNTTAARYLWWRKNGATELNGGNVSIAPTSVGVAMQTTITLSLNSTDYIELMAYQTSGGARTIGGTVADPKFETWCEAQFLGT